MALDFWPCQILNTPNYIADFITLHIKGSGNYTKNLLKFFSKRSVPSVNFLAHADSVPDVVGKSIHEKDIAAPLTETMQTCNIPAFIAGPYGATGRELHNTEHAVLVSAGIGITPFAAILGSLLREFRRAGLVTCSKCDENLTVTIASAAREPSIRWKKLRKVDFIWVVRSALHLQWFAELFHEWEAAQNSMPMETTFVDLHLYVTSGKKVRVNTAH